MSNNNITLSKNKTLKMTNVLSYEIDPQKDSISLIAKKMENYIISKGALPIGPLIQKTILETNENGKQELHVVFLRQANNFINNIDHPYRIESVVRVQNCMYVRYNGPEDKFKLAYDKITVAAFEDDVKLSNETYTIFIDHSDNVILADVFVEKIDE